MDPLHAEVPNNLAMNSSKNGKEKKRRAVPCHCIICKGQLRHYSTRKAHNHRPRDELFISIEQAQASEIALFRQFVQNNLAAETKKDMIEHKKSIDQSSSSSDRRGTGEYLHAMVHYMQLMITDYATKVDKQ